MIQYKKNFMPKIRPKQIIPENELPTSLQLFLSNNRVQFEFWKVQSGERCLSPKCCESLTRCYIYPNKDLRSSGHLISSVCISRRTRYSDLRDSVLFLRKTLNPLRLKLLEFTPFFRFKEFVLVREAGFHMMLQLLRSLK